MDLSRKSNKQIKDLISEYNKKAIELLTNQEFTQSFNLLKNAENLLNHIDQDDRLHSITFNNLGCFYKSVQKFQIALDMFIKSLSLNNFDKSLQAGTHLNVCSILSSLGSHKKALDHGLTALKLLQKIIETDTSVAKSLVFAALAAGREAEDLGKIAKAENLYLFAQRIMEEYSVSGFHEKLADIFAALKKKKMGKPRFSSVNRRNELHLIKTNQSDYSKKIVIFDDNKRKLSPKSFRTYPPILDIPRQHPRSSESPVHKKAKTNLSDIKRELFEYEEKFRRLTGTGNRNLKIRSAKVNIEKKTPVKPVFIIQDPKKPISPPSIDLNKPAIMIQKHWRGFKARLNFRQHRRKLAQQKAKEAIEELELLKIQAQNDKLFLNEENWRPKTYSPIKNKKSEKMYKTLGKFPKSGFSLHEKLSLIKIQSFGKMIVQRARYRKMRDSALVIQKNVKKLQCSKLFQKILSAILFIQYQWRKVLKLRKRMN